MGIKDKNNRIISVDSGKKNFDKIQHVFMAKVLEKLELEGRHHVLLKQGQEAPKVELT